MNIEIPNYQHPVGDAWQHARHAVLQRGGRDGPVGHQCHIRPPAQHSTAHLAGSTGGTPANTEQAGNSCPEETGSPATRIIIIDDDAQFRKMLQQMLERAGYEVAAAADGRQGEQLYRQQPAALVITDIFMPEKEGIETIIELKHEFPDVKIIAISGGGRNNGMRYLKHAERFGAGRILEKPFERQELLQAIQELLD